MREVLRNSHGATPYKTSQGDNPIESVGNMMMLYPTCAKTDNQGEFVLPNNQTAKQLDSFSQTVRQPVCGMPSLVTAFFHNLAPEGTGKLWVSI